MIKQLKSFSSWLCYWETRYIIILNIQAGEALIVSENNDKINFKTNKYYI